MIPLFSAFVESSVVWILFLLPCLCTVTRGTSCCHPQRQQSPRASPQVSSPQSCAWARIDRSPMKSSLASLCVSAALVSLARGAHWRLAGGLNVTMAGNGTSSDQIVRPYRGPRNSNPSIPIPPPPPGSLSPPPPTPRRSEYYLPSRQPTDLSASAPPSRPLVSASCGPIRRPTRPGTPLTSPCRSS